MSIVEIKHPLVKHKIGLLREAEISTKKFRELTAELARLLAYEACQDFRSRASPSRAGTGRSRSSASRARRSPWCRSCAGIGMLDGVLDMIPSAKVSVVGIARDEETLQPAPHFEKFVGQLTERVGADHRPDARHRRLDGRHLRDAQAQWLRPYQGAGAGCGARGIAAMEAAHPDVQIYAASIDSHLNEVGYIIPGLGDAGDKIFGTKHG